MDTRGVIAIAAGAAVAGVALTWVGMSALADDGTEPTTGPTRVAGPTAAPSATASGGVNEPIAENVGDPTTEPTVVAGSVDCGTGTVSVSSAEQLTAALNRAAPGTTILLADGTYVGLFVLSASGTADAPVTVCGGPGAVIDGDGVKGGYAFHVDGADYVRIAGFTITNAQKGLMADGTVGSVIEGLTVHHIGDEGIHLRNFSTDNVVMGNTVYDTGNRREKFGEGIYIGTATSNWCTITDCKPDRSDRNLVVGNTIRDVTAEGLDIKEGTSDGIARDNSFDGAGMVEKGADSWVDVKGNDWLIEGNTGIDSYLDGFQVHNVEEGWGRGNVFRNNTAQVNGSGFGFALRPVQDNVVECNNTVNNAKEGFSNVPCS
jgi:hypothetical protein